MEQYHEQRWIPVSERLPEKNKNVLVTFFFNGWNNIQPQYYVEMASQVGGKWISNSAVYKIAKSQHEVIAWMPLPEPYKKEEKNEKKN